MQSITGKQGLDDMLVIDDNYIEKNMQEQNKGAAADSQMASKPGQSV
jgi:hypothetical protein